MNHPGHRFSPSHADPILLDCRGTSCTAAVTRVDATVRRVRTGAKTLIVRTNRTEVLDAVTRWAQIGGAPYEIVEDGSDHELRVYLLPRDFGERPFLAWCSPIVDEALAG